MTPISAESLRIISRHLNHISGYSDMLRVDTRLAGFLSESEDFRLLSNEAAEIQFILTQIKDSPDDGDLITVAREEIARHLYIILFKLVKIGRDIPGDLFSQFKEQINQVKSAAFELTRIFEDHLDINPDASFERTNRDVSISPQEDSGGGGIEGEGDGSVLILGMSIDLRNKVASVVSSLKLEITPVYEDSEVMEYLKNYDVALVILDISWNRKGLDLIRAIKTDPVYFTTPVIVVSNSQDPAMIIKAIELDVEDFMPEDFIDCLFVARIKACISRHRQLRQRDLYVKKLEASRIRIARDLEAGSEYVRGLLPAPIDSKQLSIDWIFIPSLVLGGDIFGYHWISKTELAVYLIDVSGHGTEASLLSVSIMNVLKNKVLRDADFANPASVLKALNKTFLIEEQNNMYFTAWYGVLNFESRVLTFASGGSQPAILFPPDSPCENLSTHGLIIGLDQEAEYENGTRFMSPGSNLYIFSDGIFEIRKKDNQMMNLQEFTEILSIYSPEKESLTEFASRVSELSKEKKFEDDVSFIRISFKE